MTYPNIPTQPVSTTDATPQTAVHPKMHNELARFVNLAQGRISWDFANPAQRDADWPNPPDGAQCFMHDSQAHWSYSIERGKTLAGWHRDDLVQRGRLVGRTNGQGQLEVTFDPPFGAPPVIQLTREFPATGQRQATIWSITATKLVMLLTLNDVVQVNAGACIVHWVAEPLY